MFSLLASSTRLPMESDVGTAICRSRSRRSARSRTGWFPPGPRGLAELASWPDDFAERLRLHDVAKGTNLLARFQENMNGSVWTSSYSGIGGAETAAKMLQTVAQELQASRGVGGSFRDCTFFSACDISPLCRKALAHAHGHELLHVHSDVMHRVSFGVLRVLEDILARKLARFAEVKEGCGAANADADADAVVASQRDQLGFELVAECMAVLDRAEILEYIPCRKCGGGPCPTNPRSLPRLRRALWVEVAGSTCVAFSSFGQRNKWLHESTLVVLVWAAAMRCMQPDIIIHECVATFDPAVLDRLLNRIDTAQQRAHQSVVPPSSVCLLGDLVPGGRAGDVVPAAREGDLVLVPTAGCDGDAAGTRVAAATPTVAHARYSMRTLCFCPTQLGAPAVRLRRYTTFALEGAVESTVDPEDNEAMFEGIYFRSTFCSAAVYLTATDVELRERIVWAVRTGRDKRGAASCLREEDINELSNEAVLPRGPAMRLQGYRRRAAEGGLVDEQGCWKRSVVLVSLSQYPGRGVLPLKEFCPTLVRNSHLWDLVQNKPLLPEEHFLVLGYPLTGKVPERWARHFPFPHFLPARGQGSGGKSPQHKRGQPEAEVEPFTEHQIGKVTGNGMHLMAVGSVIQFTLATTKCKRDA